MIVKQTPNCNLPTTSTWHISQHKRTFHFHSITSYNHILLVISSSLTTYNQFIFSPSHPIYGMEMNSNKNVMMFTNRLRPCKNVISKGKYLTFTTHTK